MTSSCLAGPLPCDGDGVVLFYFFFKHFSGATTENIIDAYQQLTENKVQLCLNSTSNDVSTPSVFPLPTLQLANSQEQPAFQHILNIASWHLMVLGLPQ